MKDTIRTASTKAIIGDFRDEVKKFREIFTKTFGQPKVTEKIKNDHLCLSLTKKNEKGNVTAQVELHVQLKSLDEHEDFSWLEAEVEGEGEVSKKEFQAYHEDIFTLLFNCKKKVDEFSSALSKKQLDTISDSAAVPKAFTDKEWKRTKNLTLTDTGIGEAIRAFEKANELTQDRAKRCYQVYDNALLAAKEAVKLVKDTNNNLAKNKHEKSTHALRELETLAKKEIERLLKERKEYEEFVTKWEKERHDEIDQLNLWEREIRGYNSVAVTNLFFDLERAERTPNKELKLNALLAGKAVLKELKRIKTEGTNAYEAVKLGYRDSVAPLAKDWSKDVVGLVKGMPVTLKKIDSTYQEIAQSIFKEMKKTKDSDEELKKQDLKNWLA